MQLEDIEKNYSVTEDARVFSKRRAGANGRELKQHEVKGYKKVWLSVNGKIGAYTVHRLVALFHLPNPKNLPQVNHKDGNKMNNSISNLEWCTREENERHKKEVLGENSKGVKNGNFGYRHAKLYPSSELRNKLCELGIPRHKHNLAELGEMLPSSVEELFLYTWKDDADQWRVTYTKWGMMKQFEIEKDTEADARAQMLIYLIENNLLTGDN